MSHHLHLRAVAETDVKDDHAFLAAFMSTAWDNHEVECAAGVADSIEKDSATLHDLYGTSADDASRLPVYGGRPPSGAPADRPADPPLTVLDPAGVRGAAAFLTAVSFDELWSAAGDGIHASFGPGWSETLVREIHLGHHGGLRAFYGRAAAAGHAVVKAGWS
ncbi:DUF1877 family protein [Streptomyces sp. NPDC085481]|uniref:DUF1877 family protein n=1 Tax=Streptomyces sp. NPDC085481 TaxID=3365727 RepID=UPI0037D83AE1